MTTATIHIDKARISDSIVNISMTVKFTTPKINVMWYKKSTNNIEKQYNFAFIYSNINMVDIYYNNNEEVRNIERTLTPKIFRRSALK